MGHTPSLPEAARPWDLVRGGISSQGWFPSLDAAISHGDVAAFGTRAKAAAKAKEFGWAGKTVKVRRRFETVYLVGSIDFQDSTEGNICFKVLRLPMLRYETVNGVKKQPILEVRAHNAKAEGR